MANGSAGAPRPRTIRTPPHLLAPALARASRQWSAFSVSACRRSMRSIGCPAFPPARPRCSPPASPNAAAGWPRMPAWRLPDWAAPRITGVGSATTSSAVASWPSSRPKASTRLSCAGFQAGSFAVGRDSGRGRRRTAGVRLQRSVPRLTTRRGSRSRRSVDLASSSSTSAGRPAQPPSSTRRAPPAFRPSWTPTLARPRPSATSRGGQATSRFRSPVSRSSPASTHPARDCGGWPRKRLRGRRHARRRRLPLARRDSRAAGAGAGDHRGGHARRWRRVAWRICRGAGRGTATSRPPLASPTPPPASSARAPAAGRARRHGPKSTRCWSTGTLPGIEFDDATEDVRNSRHAQPGLRRQCALTPTIVGPSARARPPARPGVSSPAWRIAGRGRRAPRPTTRNRLPSPARSGPADSRARSSSGRSYARLEPERRLDRVAAAVAAVDDPLQHAHVLAEARPGELAVLVACGTS